MTTLRMGIVGIGNMGSAHVARITKGEVQGMTLTAVCDTDANKRNAAAKNLEGVTVFDDYKKLVDSGCCDAIIIATPHYFHPEIAIYAMEHGLHVLTEKPAGVYTAQVHKMNAVAQQTGKVFGIMFNQRTTPIFAKARELLREGRLGELKRVVWIITNWYRNQAYFDSGSWRATWVGEGGGVLLNQCVHNIDLWQWICGMPARIRGFVGYGKYHNIEVDDDVTVYAEYPNGATGTFITTTGEYPGTNRLEISGDRGKLVIENGLMKLWEYETSERYFCFHSDTNTPKPEIVYTETSFTDNGPAHTGICQDFANAVLHGTPLLSPGCEGLNSLEIINAIYLSDWTNSMVSLPVDEVLYEQLLREKIRTSSLRDIEDACPSNTDTLKDRWSVKW